MTLTANDATLTGGPLLPEALRNQLRLEPKLGAGNFLQYAYATNPQREVPFIYPDRLIRTFQGEEYDRFSIASLKRITEAYAAWYLSQGVTRQDPVGVYMPEGIEYLIHYIALTSIGAIPILTNGAMAPDVAAGHFKRTGAVGIFTDPTRQQQLAPHLREPSTVLFIATNESIEGAHVAPLPSWYPYQHDGDDPVMITHSSGTTGVPKAVLLQHSKFFHGIRHLLGLAPVRGTERILSSLPSSHNSAIAYAMHAILSGFEIIIVSNRSGRYVLRAIEKFAPGTVVSFPQTYVEMCDANPSEYNLSSVSLWINSGDGAHEAHVRTLVQFGYHYRGDVRIQGSQFVDGLGSSEMGHSLFRVVHTPYTNNYSRCVGFPQKWVEAAVLDEYGRELPPNVIGKLGVRGPSITAGYWNDSTLTYRSRLGGYWLTGDLVYKDDMGCFYHVDRISDAIKTREGMLYSLQAEELILKQCADSVADCAIFAVPTDDAGDESLRDAMCLARLKERVQAEPAALLERINGILKGRGLPTLAVVEIAGPDDIAAGITGKVLKRELRERYSRRREHAGQ